jgi:hypothetical protein
MKTVFTILPFIFVTAIAMLPLSAASERVPRVVAHYDVAILGGTPAGIAAAIAAEREDLHVAFISREGELGGALTRGMLTQWDAIVSTDGEEPAGDIFRRFYAALPSGFMPQRAAAYFRSRIEALHGVQWMRGERRLRAFREGSGNGARIRMVAFRDARGVLHNVAARCYIDATDDGDFAAAAGARYDVGRQDTGVDTRMQPITLIFDLGGVDWTRVVAGYDPDRFGPGSAGGAQAAGYSRLLAEYVPLSKRAIVPDANFQLQQDGTVMVNAVDVLGIDARNPEQVRLARAIAEKESQHLTAFLRSRVPGFERAYVARFASALVVRETRHVLGLTTITPNYIWQGKRAADTVALADYPLDVHPVVRSASGGAGWAEAPHVYGIPLRALVTRDLADLAIASPAISATHEAEGSVRVIPTTIDEGEAAAAACAVAVRHKATLARVARSMPLVRDVQQDLVMRGALPAQAPEELDRSAAPR